MIAGSEVAIAKITRLAEHTAQGAVRNLPFESEKRVVFTGNKESFQKTEIKITGVDESFPDTVNLFDKLLAMEREMRGDAGHTVRIVYDTRKIRAILDLLFKEGLLPPEKWDETIGRLAEIDEQFSDQPESE